VGIPTSGAEPQDR